MTTQVKLYSPPADVALPDSARRYLNELAVVERQLQFRQPLQQQRQLLERSRHDLLRIMQALEAGFEPSMPNTGAWFVGGVEHRLDVGEFTRPFYSERLRDQVKSRYCGILPIWVQERYLRAKTIFGERNIAIYSPKLEDFRMTRPVTLAIDPMMYGYIHRQVGGGVYFEVARWDTSKDLEAVQGLLEAPE